MKVSTDLSTPVLLRRRHARGRPYPLQLPLSSPAVSGGRVPNMDAGRGQNDVEEEDVVLFTWVTATHCDLEQSYHRKQSTAKHSPTLAVSLVALAVNTGWLRYRTRSIVTWNDCRDGRDTANAVVLETTHLFNRCSGSMRAWTYSSAELGLGPEEPRKYLRTVGCFVCCVCGYDYRWMPPVMTFFHWCS